MGDSLDFKTIVVIVGAFAVGYWLVSALMPRKKKPGTDASTDAGGKAGSGFHGTDEERARRARQRAEDMAEEFRQRAQGSAGGQSGIPAGGFVKDERYYGQVLGLTGDVTLEEIGRRYRELVAQYHPDKVHNLGPKVRQAAETEMKEINEAIDFFEGKYG